MSPPAAKLKAPGGVGPGGRVDGGVVADGVVSGGMAGVAAGASGASVTPSAAASTAPVRARVRARLGLLVMRTPQSRQNGTSRREPLTLNDSAPNGRDPPIRPKDHRL